MLYIEISDDFVTIRRPDGNAFSLQPIPDTLTAAAEAFRAHAATLRTPEQLQAEALAAKLATLMTAEEMIANPAIFPFWAPSLYMASGAVVQYAGELWRAKQSHTAQFGWEPPAVPALFDRLSPTSPDQPSEWASQVAYKINDLVTFAGSTYKCIQAHTSQDGWTPPVVPALWQKQ